MKLVHRHHGPIAVATVRFALIPIFGHLMVPLPPADAATAQVFDRMRARLSQGPRA